MKKTEQALGTVLEAVGSYQFPLSSTLLLQAMETMEVPKSTTNHTYQSTDISEPDVSLNWILMTFEPMVVSLYHVHFYTDKKTSI